MNNRISVFDKKKIADNSEIVIYGAGRYGELALRGLEDLGLQPVAFMDRNSREEYMGYPVLKPEEIKSHLDRVFLVASLNYYNDIATFLISNGVSKVFNIISLIERDYDETILSEYAKDEKHCIEKYRNVVCNYESNEEVVINHLEVVVTERCTLRCKDCANLIQYYERPVNFSAEDILIDIDRLLSIVDTVLDIRLLGGEPFVNKEVDTVIQSLCQKNKIKRVSIYSNATIIPNQSTIDALLNKKVFVHLSDYGSCSKNLPMIINKFEECGVKYYVHKYNDWFDLGDVKERDYSKKKIDETFNNCIMAKCHTMYRGKIYLCPRSAHGDHLGLFRNSTDEEFDLTETFDSSGRDRLKAFIQRCNSLTACKYCDGCTVDTKQVPAATQC